MRSWLKGLLLTAAAWVVLIAVYLAIEAAMGDRPFAAFDTWGPSAKFITFTVAGVTAMGALIGFASDRVRARVQQERN
ncbi:MAG TPA: hypothetical protein VK191_14900 [Symbiobacteriaceae bacterium]|nr:hypothetical protein [Symbiobacteriaceae bacterium]